MQPMTLFGIQFTLALAAWCVLAFWAVAPRLYRLPRSAAVLPLVWVHVGRVIGGTILAPGAVQDGVPMSFRVMVGLGDMITAVLALLAAILLISKARGALVLVWIFLVVATADTVNAIIQSLRFQVFSSALGVNWVIVTAYVPALLVSTLLIIILLVRPAKS
jgi:hypothetical protein